LDISVRKIINHVTYGDLIARPSRIQNIKDFSPEKIGPLPKALCKPSIQRHTRKSAILTDTPKKNSLKEEFLERKKKSSHAQIKKEKGKDNGKGKDQGNERQRMRN